MTTLITFVGKNRHSAGSKEYTKAAYLLDGQTIEEYYFGNAILKSHHWPIDRLIVVGTLTSDWGVLLDNERLEEEGWEDAATLWGELLDCTDDRPISEEQLNRLKAIVKRQWNIRDVNLVCHDAALEGHEKEIYSQYFQAVKDVSGDVVLDVTHAFRWMPMLMQSVLKVAGALGGNVMDISSVYGNVFGKTAGQLSLEAYSRIETHAKAVATFFDTWDAEPLANLLEEEGNKALAKALRVLAKHLGGNFTVPLAVDRFDSARQSPFRVLQTVIQKHDRKNDEPWIQATLDKLEDFCCQFIGKPPSSQLFVLADMYAARKMYAQALICQETCLSILAWEKAGAGMEHLDYEKMQEMRKEFVDKLPDWQRKDLHGIINTRNMVAHGSASKKEVDDVEHVNKLPEIFKNQQASLKRILPQEPRQE